MKVPKRRVKPLAVCVFHRGGRILVGEGRDAVKKETFYRPLGGTIEFSETGRETVTREIREEIGAEATDLRYLGAIENLFTYNGQPGHEIMLVYEGRLTDPSFYDRPFVLRLDDSEQASRAVWMPLEAFRSGRALLYPEGLLALIPISWG